MSRASDLLTVLEGVVPFNYIPSKEEYITLSGDVLKFATTKDKIKLPTADRRVTIVVSAPITTSGKTAQFNSLRIRYSDKGYAIIGNSEEDDFTASSAKELVDILNKRGFVYFSSAA